jgi:hypothetical protein
VRRVFGTGFHLRSRKPPPVHGGYPGEVRLRPHVVPLTDELEMRDGVMHCAICGSRSHQESNLTGGDSWYYRCSQGHEAWVGK